jgi:hypothetical protein
MIGEHDSTDASDLDLTESAQGDWVDHARADARRAAQLAVSCTQYPRETRR